MTVTAKKRRRWPWVVLAALVLLIGGPILWRNRPLNAVERRLVGTWQSSHTYSLTTFRPDRTFSFDLFGLRGREMTGTWEGSEAWLFQRFARPAPTSSWDRLTRFLHIDRVLSGTTSVDWHSIQFDDDDHFWLDNWEQLRVQDAAGR